MSSPHSSTSPASPRRGSLVSAPDLAPPVWPSREGAAEDEAAILVTLVAVEDNPSTVLSRLRDSGAPWSETGTESGGALFRGALEAITPWQ
ncbi:hypothetical protein J2X34_003102 [Rhodococcus sp. BE178]